MNQSDIMMQQLSPSARGGSNLQYSPTTMQQQQQQRSPSGPYNPTQGQYEGNMDADMYLQPSNNNNGYIREKPQLQRNIQEHDSGVLDVDHIQPDLDSLAGTPRNSGASVTPRNSHTSAHSPGLPVPPYNRHQQPLPSPVVQPMGLKRPESLAVKGHEYEELPGQKYLSTQYTYPEGEGYVPQATPSRSVTFGGSKENLCHSGSNGSMMSDRPAPPVYRKRHNPLYEEEKDAMVPKKSKAQGGLCQCPCLAILIFSILSLVTFVLVILLLADVISTSDSSSDGYPRTGALTDGNYSLEYTELLREYRTLKEKVNRLEAAASSNHDAVNSRIQQLNGEINRLDSNVDRVTKMEGPRGFNGSRGPPGAGDLSQCVHEIRKNGAAAVSKAETPWYPFGTDDQNRVVMGAYCSHDYEDAPVGVFLQSEKINDDVTRYRCVCGPINSTPRPTTHECKLHLWHCPRQS